MHSIKPGFLRVSQILSRWTNFSQVPEEILKEKTIIGSEVHAAINGMIEGVLSFTEKRSQGYFASFQEWVAATGAEIVHSELRLYELTLRYTGAVDALVIFPDSNALTLVDFKTSHSPNDKLWQLQAHFYFHLLRANGYQNLSESILFLKLDKKGKTAAPRTYRYDPKVWNICLSLLNAESYFSESLT